MAPRVTITAAAQPYINPALRELLDDAVPAGAEVYVYREAGLVRVIADIPGTGNPIRLASDSAYRLVTLLIERMAVRLPGNLL